MALCVAPTRAPEIVAVHNDPVATIEVDEHSACVRAFKNELIVFYQCVRDQRVSLEAARQLHA